MTGSDWVDGKVIDDLERMVGRDVVHEIIDLFLKHAPMRVAVAREAGHAGDLDSVARELHALKSSAGSIGALGLQRLAEDMERLAVDGQEGAVRARLDELTVTLDHVKVRLNEVCEERPS